eukprot:s315_g17.t1
MRQDVGVAHLTSAIPKESSKSAPDSLWFAGASGTEPTLPFLLAPAGCRTASAFSRSEPQTQSRVAL